jgi:hypothetical protein
MAIVSPLPSTRRERGVESGTGDWEFCLIGVIDETLRWFGDGRYILRHSCVCHSGRRPGLAAVAGAEPRRQDDRVQSAGDLAGGAYEKVGRADRQRGFQSVAGGRAVVL